MKSELKSAGMVRTIAALQEERDALQVENERLKAILTNLRDVVCDEDVEIIDEALKGGK
jgi:regulator of replication initiation timing